MGLTSKGEEYDLPRARIQFVGGRVRVKYNIVTVYFIYMIEAPTTPRGNVDKRNQGVAKGLIN